MAVISGALPGLLSIAGTPVVYDGDDENMAPRGAKGVIMMITSDDVGPVVVFGGRALPIPCRDLLLNLSTPLGWSVGVRYLAKITFGWSPVEYSLSQSAETGDYYLTAWERHGQPPKLMSYPDPGGPPTEVLAKLITSANQNRSTRPARIPTYRAYHG